MRNATASKMKGYSAVTGGKLQSEEGLQVTGKSTKEWQAGAAARRGGCTSAPAAPPRSSRRSERLEHRARRLDGGVNVRLGVRQRGEASLKLAGRQVHAVLQHAAVEPAKLGGVCAAGLVGRWLWVGVSWMVCGALRRKDEGDSSHHLACTGLLCSQPAMSCSPGQKSRELRAPAALASSNECTGPSQKKKPNMPEMEPPHMAAGKKWVWAGEGEGWVRSGWMDGGWVGGCHASEQTQIRASCEGKHEASPAAASQRASSINEQQCRQSSSSSSSSSSKQASGSCRARTVAGLLGSVQDAVDQALGDLVQVLVGAWEGGAGRVRRG